MQLYVLVLALLLWRKIWLTNKIIPGLNFCLKLIENKVHSPCEISSTIGKSRQDVW